IAEDVGLHAGCAEIVDFADAGPRFDGLRRFPAEVAYGRSSERNAAEHLDFAVGAGGAFNFAGSGADLVLGVKSEGQSEESKCESSRTQTKSRHTSSRNGNQCGRECSPEGGRLSSRRKPASTWTYGNQKRRRVEKAERGRVQSVVESGAERSWLRPR